MAPLGVWRLGTLAAAVPEAKLAKAAATSVAVLVAFAVYVNPATVTDWPDDKPMKVTAEVSVTPKAAWMVAELELGIPAVTRIASVTVGSEVVLYTGLMPTRSPVLPFNTGKPFHSVLSAI